MALYELSDSQKQIIEDLINNFPVQGTKETIKKFDLETDEILKSLSNPIPDKKEGE